MNTKKSLKFVLAVTALLGGLSLASCAENGEGNSDASSAVVPMRYTGAGEPSADFGKDGDTYTDTTTGSTYTKIGGAWVKDSTGSYNYTGVGTPTADLGKDGDTYTNTTTGDVYTKQNGTWIKTKEGKGEDVAKLTVSFDLAGGLMSDGSATVSPQTIDYGSWALNPGDPTKKHCTFLGWYAGSAKWDFETPIYKNLTLVAKYNINEDEKITITVDPGNGQATYTVESFEGDSPRLDTPSKDGYAFKGWYIDGNESNPWTGVVRADTLNGHKIVALFEKSTFNFKFTVNTDGTLTITGLINLQSAIADIPNSIAGHTVTAIGETAFQSRIQLVQVNIPDSVTTIDPRAFAGARKLSTIYVSGSNKNFKSDDGVLYSRDGTTLVYCPPKNTQSTFTVPAGVKKIGDYAFYNHADEGISGVNFPDGLEEIGNRAFYGNNNSSFTSLSFPNSLKRIGDYAFAYVSSSAEGTIQQFNWGTGLEEIGYAAFFGQYFKDTLTLPEGLKKIGERAFMSCSAITDLVLPSTIEYLAPGFAAYAQGIKTIAINGNNSHYKVVNNTIYTIDGETLVYSPANRIDTQDIVVEANTVNIADYAFYYAKFVKSITLPASVKSLGVESFRDCCGLTSFAIPDSVTTMGEDCFTGCSSLASITIGSGLNTIAPYAFSKTGLTSISIPANIKKIEHSAFWGDTKLKTVKFAEGLEEVEYLAFYGTSVSGDEEASVTTKGSLTSLTLPLSLKKIGNGAFSGQPSLETVKFGNVEEMGTNVFKGDDKLARIEKTPGATSIEIENASVLYTANYKKVMFAIASTLTGELTLNSATEEIAAGAFAEAKKLTKITLPASLKKIGEEAFYNSIAYSGTEDWTLDIPASVTEIGEHAFWGINHLTGINFASDSQLTSIGDEAFVFADIASLNLPASLRSIGEGAFCLNGKLTSLTLNEGLTTLGANAFDRCTKLEGTIALPSTLTKVGANVFGRTSISGVTLADSNTSYKLDTGFLLTKDGTHLVAFMGGKDATNVTVPASVTCIDSYSMSYIKTGLTALTLPAGLTTIEEYAFAYSSSIKAQLNIPASVTSIGKEAFRSWTGSQRINFNISQELAALTFDKDYVYGCSATLTYKSAE